MKRILAALALICAGSAGAQDIPRPPLRDAVGLRADAPPAQAPGDRIGDVADADAQIRPRLRPGPQARLAAAAPPPVARPRERPDLSIGYDTRPQRRAELDLFAYSPFAPLSVDRPDIRPARIVQAAITQQVERQRGAICGDPAIQGEAIGSIAGAGGCGVEGAVRVRSIAGVSLQSNPTIDCRTAQAMKTWITDGIIPAVGDTGGGVARLRVVAHYACRNRVGGSSGNRRLSEHATGRAVDIAGIGLKSGREITVLTDWNKRGDGAILRRIWQAACGPFGTVLGPEANAAHRDHFHVDTARYRSGSYCQ